MRMNSPLLGLFAITACGWLQLSNVAYGSIAGGIAVPILIEDGFTDDVIVEANAAFSATNGYGAEVTNTVSDSIDNLTFYQQGLPGGASGLPVNGLIMSSADSISTFQLEPATQLNVLLLESGGTYSPGEAEMRLAIPQAFPSIYFLATSYGSRSQVSGQINFADGTAPVPFTITVPVSDGGDPSAAISGLGEVNSVDGTFLAPTTSPHAIFQVALDLIALGADSHPIASIDFLSNAVEGAGVVNIFGLSGAAASQGQSLVKGIYSGLVGGDETVGSQATHGLVQLSVSKTLTLSGYVLWKGQKYPFKGATNGNGFFNTTIPLKTGGSLSVNLVGVADGVRVTLNDGTAQPTGYIHGSAFDGKKHFGPAGLCNGMVEPVSPSDPKVLPSGTGWFQTKVSSTGTFSIIGTLADGQPFSAGGYLNQDGWGTYYTGLYANAAKGSLFGRLGFFSQSLEPTIVESLTQWTCPANPKAKFFRSGFTTQLAMIGATYQPPNAHTNAFGIDPTTQPYVSGLLTGGDFSSDVWLQLATNLDSVVAGVTATSGTVPTGFTMKVTPKTGLFAGSFIHPVTNKKVAFKGLLVSPDLIGLSSIGVFLGPDEPGNLQIWPASSPE